MAMMMNLVMMFTLLQHEYEGIDKGLLEYDDDDYDDDDNNVDHDDEVDEEYDDDDGHPKQHEDEGIDNRLEEAKTGADACNCQTEKRKLSPEFKIKFNIIKRVYFEFEIESKKEL